MMRALSVLLSLAAISFCIRNADAQMNSRNWVNIQQAMVGGTVASMTTTPFSAFNSIWPFKYYSIAVATQVTASPWSVNLDGSNDQIAWTTIATQNSGANPSGGVVFQSSAEPVLYLRLSATKLGSGDKITVTAVGVP